MRYENKKWERKGDVFSNSKESFDLSKVRYLHSGVDTVKQLFNCLLKKEVMDEIEFTYESGFEQVFEINGAEYLISKSGKSGGYQWILRNNDLGFVVMLKSFFAEVDKLASHIKIEVSPQTIYELGEPEKVTKAILKLGNVFGHQLVEHAVAAHIAVDLKGFEIPSDFEYSLVTKAKRQMRHLGISDMSVTLAETAAVYGDRQTFTFGSPGALQFQLYDKVTEAIKRDKIAFWEYVWSKTPAIDDCFKSEYESGDSVKRIEMRFHHSIIQQFCNGTQNKKGKFIEIKNYTDLCKHLTALWRYALNNFRLQHSSSYIHPVWQLLEEDIQIYSPVLDFMYKRQPKPPSSSSKKNLSFMLAHYYRLAVRKGYTVDYAVKSILKLGFDAELLDYFGLFGHGSRDFLYECLYQYITEKFVRLRLMGVAA